MNDDQKAISKVGQERWSKYKQLQEKRQQLSNAGNTVKHKKRKPSIQNDNRLQDTTIKNKIVSASNTPLSEFLNMDDDHRRFETDSKKVNMDIRHNVNCQRAIWKQH